MNDIANFTSRRALLKGFGLFATAAASGLSFNVLAQSQDHSAHHHHADPKRQGIIDAALECVKNGEACSQHCIELFKEGDTSVAACADAVQEMLASCNALAKLAAHNSRHLKAFVEACIGVCEDCEKECREHEDKHAECKACADSCANCIDACKEYLAA